MVALVVILTPALAAADRFTQDLQLGSVSAEVAFLAEVLRQLPDADPEYDINDAFGPQDQAAVTRFQYDHLEIRDPTILGRVEARTRDGLNALISDATPQQFNANVEAEYAAYREARTPVTEQALQTALEARYTAMECLCETNTAKAREVAVDKKFRKHLPRQLRTLVEEGGVRIKGYYEVTIEQQDAFPHTTVVRRDLVTNRGVRYRLPRTFTAPGGALLAIRGTRMGHMLIPGTAPEDVRVVRSDLQFPVTKPGPVQRLAAILLDFPDHPHTETPQAVAQAMNEIVTYYNRTSYGQTRVELEITPVWIMSTRTLAAPDYLACNFNLMFDEAMQRAASYFDFSTFDVVMPIHGGYSLEYLVNLRCAEHGNDGAGGAKLFRTVIQTPDGPRAIGRTIVSDGMVTSTDKPHVQIHEFTHTFGIGHTGIISCNNSILSTDVRRCSVGNSPTDIMGVGTSGSNGWGIGDLNAALKNELGWFNATYRVQDVANPGTYTLGVLERSAPGVKALRIARNNTDTLWVEYRRPEGNDQPIGGAQPLQLGAFVHARLPARAALEGEWLIETSVVPPYPRTGASLGISLNTTWWDPISRWAITPTAMTTDSLTVRIDQIATSVSCSPHRRAAAVGQTVRLQASGGIDPIVWQTINGPVQTGSGRTFDVSFPSAGTYFVEARIANTSLADRCEIQVTPDPSVEFSVNGLFPDPVTVGTGENILIEWQSTHATGCSVCYQLPHAPQGICESIPLNGSMTDGPITDPTVYWLSCAGAVKADADWQLVNVASGPVAATPEGNNAECLYAGAIPNPFVHEEDVWLLHSGETRRIVLQFRNSGSTTWRTDETPHRAIMVDAGASANWSAVVAPLSAVAGPYEYALFEIDIHYLHPNPPCGQSIDIPITWRMAENGVPFGEACRTQVSLAAVCS